MLSFKKCVTILIIGTLILSLLFSVIPVRSQSQISLGSPLVILDDNYELDFIFKGNGTKENPYIIENLSIDVFAQPAILISNSQKYAIFRNITIITQKQESAIKIINSRNVVFENITVIGSLTTDYGVLLNNVTNVKLKDIRIKDTLLPIKFEKSQDMRNEFYNITFNDVQVFVGHDLENTIIKGEYSNIYIYNATNVILENLTVGTRFNVYLITAIVAEEVNNLTIRNSVVKGTRAINIRSAKDVQVYNTTIIFAAYALTLENVENVVLNNIEFEGSKGDIAISLSKFYNAKVSDIESYGVYFAFDSGEDLKIQASSIKGGAIDISNVVNATLEDVKLQDSIRTVLGIRYSHNIKIVDTEIINVKFVYGELEKEKPVNAIEIASSTHITFKNTLIQKVYTALYLLFSSNITLEKTTIYDSAYALQSYYSSSLLIKDSLIEKAGVTAIVLRGSAQIIIEKSIIKNSKAAIFALSTEDLKVTYCDFVDNDEEIVEDSKHDYLYNYWDKYEGKDNNGDNIGDTPYKVSTFSEDPYPRMNPLKGKNQLPTPVPEKDYTDLITAGTVVGIIVVIIVANVIYWMKARRGEL